MKKSFKLLAVVAAVFMALTFTGCAELANALGGALFGQNQTLKVTSSVSELNGKTVWFYVEEYEADSTESTGYKKTSAHQDLKYTINGNKVSVSEKLQTLHGYTIYVSGVEGTNYNYGNSESKPVVTKADVQDNGVTAEGPGNDIIVFAGNIDYEIVLTVVNKDIVAKIKGTQKLN